MAPVLLSGSSVDVTVVNSLGCHAHAQHEHASSRHPPWRLRHRNILRCGHAHASVKHGTRFIVRVFSRCRGREHSGCHAHAQHEHASPQTPLARGSQSYYTPKPDRGDSNCIRDPSAESNLRTNHPAFRLKPVLQTYATFDVRIQSPDRGDSM